LSDQFRHKYHFLKDGSKMSALFSKKDWSRTDLGPLEFWPQSLKTAVGIVLNSRFPMFISWGPKRIFLYNDPYSEILGKKHPAALGEEFVNIWSEIWKDIEPLILAVDNGEARYQEDMKLIMNRHGYDEETFFTFSYSPIYDENDHVTGLFCACVETTARKKSEQQLKSSEANLKLALAAANMGTWTINLKTNQVAASPELSRILGLSSYEDDVVKSIQNIIHPDDRERTAKTYQTALEKNLPYENEYRIIRADGEVRWIFSRGHAVYDDNGHPIAISGVTVDINDRKVKAEAEKLAFDSLKDFADAIPHFVWITNENGESIYFNQKWVEFTGATVEDRKTWANVVHPEDTGPARKAWEESVKTGAPYNIDYRLRNVKTGHYQWFRVYGVPYRDEAGRIVRWYGTCTDINNSRVYEEKLKESRDEAERANRIKSAFLANMSHEIRTPLGAMIGFADLLRDPKTSTQDRESYLNILIRNGHQLSVIINDILDLSKVEAGHMNFEYLEVNPNEIASDVVSLLNMKAEEKDIALEYKPDFSLPGLVVTDAGRVKQVLLNLVTNAIKFTEKGNIKIKGYSKLNENGKPQIHFEIQDTGIGIADSQLDKIFDVFVQADDSVTRRFGGTGLGLALSRRLARALGGDVKVLQSTEGKGTTFLFTFEDQPAMRNRELELKLKYDESTEIKENSLDGVKVLIVDDAPDNQHLIGRYLTRRGATIESAENGAEGTKKALAGAYDIVLMDIQMPVMDGYTATQYLRSAGYKKPNLALTAHADYEVRTKHLNVGCKDQLTKPINQKDLIRLIVNLVHQ